MEVTRLPARTWIYFIRYSIIKYKSIVVSFFPFSRPTDAPRTNLTYHRWRWWWQKRILTQCCFLRVRHLAMYVDTYLYIYSVNSLNHLAVIFPLNHRVILSWPQSRQRYEHEQVDAQTSPTTSGRTRHRDRWDELPNLPVSQMRNVVRFLGCESST